MTGQMKPEDVARWYLIIGVCGIFLVVASLTLIFFDPSFLSPWLTTLSGALLIVLGFRGRSAANKNLPPK